MEEENNLINFKRFVQESPKDKLEFLFCPKCSSDIEILSIEETKTNEEISLFMKYRCLKENLVNNISFNEFIRLMKEKKIEKIEKLNDECGKHSSKKFISYCFDCNNHLCEDCLKSGAHLKHVKNNIIEVKPLEEELDIVREVINDYKIKLEETKKEKEEKKKEYNKLMNHDKIKLERELDNIREKNNNKKIIELENNKKKYIIDIDKLKNEFENKIRKRKIEYLEEKNQIYNKYKLITQKYIINHKNKINELINNYEKEINKYKFEKKIENYENMIKINKNIYEKYYNYNNNYYNSININSLLIYYTNNNYINDKIMKVKLKDKYDFILNIINNRKGKIHLKIDELKNEYEERIKIIEEQHKNEINKLKNEVS